MPKLSEVIQANLDTLRSGKTGQVTVLQSLLDALPEDEKAPLEGLLADRSVPSTRVARLLHDYGAEARREAGTLKGDDRGSLEAIAHLCERVSDQMIRRHRGIRKP
jgi:hypothetical protein